MGDHSRQRKSKTSRHTGPAFLLVLPSLICWSCLTMKLKKDSIRVALASLGPLGVAAAAGWEQCRDRVLAIRQGHLAHNSINNETLDRYIYHGNVRGLHSSFPRDQYLAVTYEGQMLGACTVNGC